MWRSCFYQGGNKMKDDVKLFINVPSDFRDNLKSHAAKNGMSMKDYVISVISREIKREENSER